MRSAAPATGCSSGVNPSSRPDQDALPENNRLELATEPESGSYTRRTARSCSKRQKSLSFVRISLTPCSAQRAAIWASNMRLPLGPVLGHAEDEPSLPYLAFRREVDRHLGMQGTRIDYGGESEAVAVTVGLSHGLGRIARLVADIPGFELVSLSQRGRGEWVLEARPVAGFQLKESLFLELAGDPSAGAAVSF